MFQPKVLRLVRHGEITELCDNAGDQLDRVLYLRQQGVEAFTDYLSLWEVPKPTAPKQVAS